MRKTKRTCLKRLVALALTTVMTMAFVILATGCASASMEDNPIRVAGLKGPTSIGMVRLMEESEKGLTKDKYEFTLAGSPDEVTPKLIKGELDIAAVPANLASVLYNNTDGKVKLLAINTLGVIYIVDRSARISSVADLKDKTIYGSGKGSTPEYSLKFILSENGLDPDTDVKIEWKSEHSEVVQALANDPEAIGILPQPFVTVAMSKIDGLNIALDMTKEWDALDNGSMMITGVLAVNKDFADNNPERLKTFLEEYAASVDYVNDNVADAAVLCEKFDIIKAAVAEVAIPYCNIVCITGEDMWAPISGYLQVLCDANPQAVGGKVPGEDFVCKS